MKFGVQLYGPLNSMQGETMDKLRGLAEAGITEIEPCVTEKPFSGMEGVFWPIGWLMEHSHEILGLGLKIKSAHVFAENLAKFVPQMVKLAEKAGIRQYVVKTPRDMDALTLHQAALNYMKAADALAEAGVMLLLHNEAADIQAKIAGKSAYEHLLDLCMGKVFAQVDVGWVKFGGEEPMEFLKRNAWRVKSIHHKDFGPGNEPVDVPVGTGIMDLESCFGFAMTRDIPQIIDQEHFGGDVPGELAAACGRLSGYSYASRKNTVSYLNTYNILTGQVEVLARFDKIIEAPEWNAHDDTIIFNSDGHIFSFDPRTRTEKMIDTGICDNCNNDHVLSPDGKMLAVSHMTFEGGYNSRVYTLPLGGGEPTLITPEGPSYLHGWSPDGKELAYCAFREIDGKTEVDIYTIPVEGGEERRITDGGFNDGPEYSPDGKYIWFNSTRSGLMQVWRMDRDGGNRTQITKNSRNNWFPHLSPDGSKIVYLSYGPEQLSPEEHLPNMPVELWIMNADGTNQHRILSMFGGQGSINVNSWAGDGERFAFVSYEMSE